MKKKEFYSTTKGQLITIWVFGLTAAIYSMNAAEGYGGDPFFGFLGIGTLFFLVFYTIGWRTNKKLLDE